jgi:hypothetical protein
VPSLNRDKEAGAEEHGNVKHSREDLHAFEAERMFQRGFAPSDTQGRIADQHGCKIAQIVEGIADERHASRDDTAVELNGGDNQVHGHGRYEPLAQIQGFEIMCMVFHFCQQWSARTNQLSPVSLHESLIMVTDVAVHAQGIYDRFYYCQAERAISYIFTHVNEEADGPVYPLTYQKSNLIIIGKA